MASLSFYVLLLSACFRRHSYSFNGVHSRNRIESLSYPLFDLFHVCPITHWIYCMFACCLLDLLKICAIVSWINCVFSHYHLLSSTY